MHRDASVRGRLSNQSDLDSSREELDFCGSPERGDCSPVVVLSLEVSVAQGRDGILARGETGIAREVPAAGRLRGGPTNPAMAVAVRDRH